MKVILNESISGEKERKLLEKQPLPIQVIVLKLDTFN